jgi:rare lipoprotein A
VNESIGAEAAAKRFGGHVTVTNKANGRSVRVRITDRGLFIKGRCIDLSRTAANAIGVGRARHRPVAREAREGYR